MSLNRSCAIYLISRHLEHFVLLFSVKLTVLGTPAEEGGGGKVELIDAGAFEDIDLAIIAHPAQINLPMPIVLARKG